MALREEARTRQETHEPGDHHRYRIECEVCGQRGTIRLSVDPDRAADSALDDLAAWGHQAIVDAGGDLSLEAAKASARSRRRAAAQLR